MLLVYNLSTFKDGYWLFKTSFKLKILIRVLN